VPAPGPNCRAPRKAKAKAEEAKVKAAETPRLEGELLGKAQDRVAEKYIKDQKAKGVIVKPTPIAPPAPPAAVAPAPAAVAPAPAAPVAAQRRHLQKVTTNGRLTLGPVQFCRAFFVVALESNHLVSEQRCFGQFDQRADCRTGNQRQIAEAAGQRTGSAQANIDALGNQLFNHALQPITGTIDLIGQAEHGSVRHQKRRIAGLASLPASAVARRKAERTFAAVRWGVNDDQDVLHERAPVWEK
jgi:hypothetical protein